MLSIEKMLESEEATHLHGDRAHYDIKLDIPTENGETVKTDKDIDIILEKGNEFLDGIWIQYFYVPREEMFITNPSIDKGHHH